MLKHIFKGIQAYFGAFGLISKLRLWKFFAIPILISLVTAITIGFLAYGWSDNLGHLISKLWVWEWGKDTFAKVGSIIGGLFIVALGLILYKHIVMALSAPFMSPVSEKIEAYLLNAPAYKHRQTTFGQQLWRGVKINLRNLGMELFWTIPILLIGFVPVIGLISSVLLLLLQAYYAGFGNMDYTLERHFNYRDSIVFVKQNTGHAIGNGLVFMLGILIPVLGIVLVLPLSVTAATKTTVSALQADNHYKLEANAFN